MTTGETESSTAQILESTRDLAVDALGLLAQSKCLSSPQFDPDVDLPAAQLTKLLGYTDAVLAKLIHCLQELIGNDNIGYGPLGNEIGYQIDTVELPDPLDLEDNQHNIHEWIMRIRFKLPKPSLYRAQ